MPFDPKNYRMPLVVQTLRERYGRRKMLLVL
jgi:hypothetical protein